MLIDEQFVITDLCLDIVVPATLLTNQTTGDRRYEVRRELKER